MAKKILVIDDSAQDRKIIKRFLGKVGFEEIVFAETGEEGIQKTEAEEPDLVITDTRLPGIDGFEVCRRIREKNFLFNPKVIIITGAIDAVDAVKARKMGADDYCAKTSDFTPLIEAINHVFGN